jgi:hypothetical protein
MSQVWQMSHPLLSLEAEGESCSSGWSGVGKTRGRKGWGNLTLIGIFSYTGSK